MRVGGFTTVSIGTGSNVAGVDPAGPSTSCGYVRAVISDDQCGRYGVVAFAPHRGPHRHDLADNRLGRELSARHDGCDVIDPDPTDHFPPLLYAASSELINRLFAPYTHRSALPNQTEVKRYRRRRCGAAKTQ